MTNHNAAEPGNREEKERLALRVLCQWPANDPLRAELVEELRAGSWSDAGAEAVFKALARIRPRSDDHETYRRELAAIVTRMGFPDFSFEELFEPHGMSQHEAFEFVRSLRFRDAPHDA